MVTSHKGLIKIVVLLLLIGLAIFSSYYEVQAEEVGIVTRFGKFTGTTAEPGPHLKIPIVDHVTKIPAKRQLKLEFGFRTDEAGVKSTFKRTPLTAKEATILTGDLNIAVVEWIVHYRIIEPATFLFKVRDVAGTIHNLSEATMRTVVGDYSVTEVIKTKREEIADKAREHLAELCKHYETGVAIDRVEIKDANPPEAVKASFNEVNEAEQERDRLQNEAFAQYNKRIPKAKGIAKRQIKAAEGYATERINNARGEVDRFVSIQKEYVLAPEVTRTRLYLEAINQTIPNAGKLLIVDEELKGMVPMLMPLGNKTTPLSAAGAQGGAR